VTEQLYKKVMKGKRTTYELVVDDSPDTVLTFTEGQCLTAAGALGVTLLTIFERNIPPHKRIARKIQTVKDSVLDLYAGTGEPIQDDIANLIFKTWDKVMREMEAGV
jgi:hypothetical protein